MFYKCEFRKLLFLLAVPAAMASVYVRRFIIAHGSQDVFAGMVASFSTVTSVVQSSSA